MSEFWWFQPGWKDALCARCSVNIWKSGGDPDHGYCYECLDAMKRIEEQTPNRGAFGVKAKPVWLKNQNDSR